MRSHVDRWRRIAIEAADELGEDSAVAARIRLMAEPWRDKAKAGKRRALTRAARRDRVSPLPETYGGKRLPHGRHEKCAGCGKWAIACHMAGAYCSTCRQRGPSFGWCGCGAALYSDGLCNQVRRHERMVKEQPLCS